MSSETPIDLDLLEALQKKAAYDGNGPLCYATPTERGLLDALPALIAECRSARAQWYATLIELRAWRTFAGYLHIHGMQPPAPYEDQVTGGETPDAAAERLRAVLKQIANSHPLASGPWLTLWHVGNLAREALGRAAYHPELNTFADPELQMLREENARLRRVLHEIATDPYIDQNAAATRARAQQALNPKEPDQ